jgi:hypothetical protein
LSCPWKKTFWRACHIDVSRVTDNQRVVRGATWSYLGSAIDCAGVLSKVWAFTRQKEEFAEGSIAESRVEVCGGKRRMQQTLGAEFWAERPSVDAKEDEGWGAPGHFGAGLSALHLGVW